MRRLDNATPSQASLIALLTSAAVAVITLVVAFVPAWKPLETGLIAALGGAIATLVPIASLIAHAIHGNRAASAGLSEQEVTGLVRSELSRVLKAAVGGDPGSSTTPGRVIPVRPADPPDPAA